MDFASSAGASRKVLTSKVLKLFVTFDLIILSRAMFYNPYACGGLSGPFELGTFRTFLVAPFSCRQYLVSPPSSKLVVHLLLSLKIPGSGFVI